VDELADVPRITNFVLGKYARTITPDQRARFTPRVPRLCREASTRAASTTIAAKA
jgi:ABC-type transporter MlaC component